MGLKIVLEWYDKRTAIGQGEELSKDLGDDESVLNALGIPVENNINNGGFNVLGHWVDIIQPFFSTLSPWTYTTIKLLLSTATTGSTAHDLHH